MTRVYPCLCGSTPVSLSRKDYMRLRDYQVQVETRDEEPTKL